MTRMTGDELGALYRQHGPALRLYARQWPGGDEDLVQEAFVKLAQQATRPRDVLPWLYRVVRNAALATSRSEARRRRRQNQSGASEVWFATADDLLDGRAASELLAELPLDEREIVVARIWGGLNFDEIARLVGSSLPTAHRKYQTALAKLRERIDTKWTPTKSATI